ncbi:MAG: hypothetical protein FJ265_15050, partial [Planctomycetes bacterium]|nr:hypothetical protein [Planctomycetota bacterium]
MPPTMFRRLLLAGTILLVAATCTNLRTRPERSGTTDPPAPPGAARAAAAAPARPGQILPEAPPLQREFRGAWVATVDNIETPSRPGLPTETARSELDAIVARAVQLRLNALVFQVRPAADAFYPSTLEPWSEWLTGAQGRAPKPAWDPLQHLIAACHAQGLEVHAWFNPYRAAHPAGKSRPAKNHVLRRLPDACVAYGAYRWMDPGEPRSAAHSLAVIRDVVARYDVDGVHIDDYFYPYPDKGQDFPDQRSFQRYQQKGGRLARAEWRRANIDGFVQRLYDVVHHEKPWVQVGISPFGIARPGVPAGIQAGIDQYAQLYADVQRWLHEGWLDYLAPQLYWPIDQKPQSFAVLLPWWHAQNRLQRHIWPGINPGRMLQAKPPIRAGELTDQLALLRAQPVSQGHVHFSFKALRTDAPHVAGALRAGLYAEPAVAPASAWLKAPVPGPTDARVERDGDAAAVVWHADPATRFV